MKENKSTSQATISKSSRAFVKWRDIIQQVFYGCWSTLYFSRVGGEKKRKDDCRPGREERPRKLLHRNLEEKSSACSRLEKRPCSVCDPKTSSLKQIKDICLINMCKGSYGKKICDWSWCFPRSNKIILLIERSEAEESKGSFPLLLLFLSHWKIFKTFISSRHFHFSNFFTLRNCSPPNSTMTTQPLVQKHESNTTHPNNNNLFNLWQDQWPTANALGKHMKTNPVGKRELLSLSRVSHVPSVYF